MAFNVDEIIFDRFTYIESNDLTTGSLLYTLRQTRDASLNFSAESDEILDGTGSPIARIFRAKTATLSGTNALFSIGLLAAQAGSEKVDATSAAPIVVPATEVLTISEGKITLAHKAAASISYIYGLSSNGLGTVYTAGATASDTEFVQDDTGEVTTITTPTGVVGKIYVQYTYSSAEGIHVPIKTSDFPKSTRITGHCIFHDACDDSIEYAGIITGKAKLDASSVDVPFSATDGHSWSYLFEKNFCSASEDLLDFYVLP